MSDIESQNIDSKHFKMSLGCIFITLSALVYTFSLPPCSQAFLGWVALVPAAAYIAYSSPSYADTLRLGFLFGIVHFLSSLFWLTSLTWAGWAILSLYLTIYPMLWFLHWRFLNQAVEWNTLANLKVAALGALSWISLEWLRSWILTGFGWNGLGATQSSTVSIIQLADFGGIYAVSLLVAFANLVFARAAVHTIHSIRVTKQPRQHTDLYAVILLTALAFWYGISRVHEPVPIQKVLDVVCIQPSIRQDPWGNAPERESFQKMLWLTQESLNERGLPDLLLWPESITGGSATDNGPFRQAVEAVLLRYEGINFLTGSLDYEGKDVFNAAMLFQHRASDPLIYHKQHLVPFGEFVPFSRFVPWVGRMIGVGTNFSRGDSATIMTLKDSETNLTPLICFEDTVSPLARDAVLRGADILVNITNDGWFKESAGAEQHFRNAIFRTVETRRPLIRCSNNGVTAVVDSKGIPRQIFRDEKTQSIHEPGWMEASVDVPEKRTTLYLLWGDWLPKLALGICLINLAVVLFSNRKRAAELASAP